MKTLLASFCVFALWSGLATAQAISAVLEPVQLVDIRPVVAGRLADLSAIEGQDASEGAILARIDARVQHARVRLAEIAAEASAGAERAAIVVAQAEGLHDRVSAARIKGAALPWEVKQAKQALDLARADMRIAAETQARLEAQLALEQATLQEFYMSAPFAGTILEVPVTLGEIVDPQTVVITLGDLDRLSATAFVPVEWIDGLTVGDRLRTDVEAAGTPVFAQITVIDPRIDPASQSVRLKVELDNPDRRLLAGSVVFLDRE